jgi:raffinose/stachyose/melibiose transport system substrate-binding protein
LRTIGIVTAAVFLLAVASIRAADAPVTLEIWDQFTEGQPSRGFEVILKGFTQKYPHVTFRRNPVSAGQISELVKAGLVTDLTEAYDRFGWRGRMLETVRDWVTIEGRVYGVPNELEVDSVVFYRRSDFEQLGLERPRSWDDFLRLLRAYRDAGKPGLMLPNREGAMGMRMWNLISDAVAGPQAVDDVLFGDGSWVSPAFAEAASMTLQLFKSGLLVPNANAISRSEGRAIFVARRASLLFSGGWDIKRLYNEDARADEIDFFVVPPARGRDIVPMFGVGSGFYIPSYVLGAKQAAALRLLDYLMSPETARLWVEEVGVLPGVPLPGQVRNVRPMMAQSVRTIATAKRSVRNLTNMFPGDVNSAVRAAAQALVAERITPEGYVAELDRAWAKAKREGRVLRVKR